MFALRLFSGDAAESRNLWLARVVGAGALLVSLVTPVPAQTAPQEGKAWSIRSLDGEKREIRVNKEIVSTCGWDIPVANITRVAYDQHSSSIGREFAEAFAPILWTGYPIGVALILAPFKTREHFLTLNWMDEGIPRELTFRAEKGNYQTILQALTQVTGKPWRNLPAELKKERNAATPVVFDHAIAVGGVTLKPNTYRLAIRELAGGDAAAVFYGKGPRPVALAPVKLIAISSQVKAPQPVYRKIEGSGHEALVEILMPDRTLQFEPKPAEAETPRAAPPAGPVLN